MYTPAVPALMSEASVTIEDEEIGLVDQFCYLDDGGTERRSRMQQRGRSGGESVASSPTGVILSSRDSIYNACIRSVLLYGSETCGMTKKITDRIQTCDCMTLRYMTGVTLAYRVASEEGGGRCGVKPALTVVEEGRLRWFGHVKRQEGEGLLREVIEVEVPRVRARGHQRKQCKVILRT